MASRRSFYGLDGLNFLTASMQTAFGSFVVIQLVANHWPAEAIGFALTISTVSSLVSQVPAGAFIDSIDDKRRALRLGVTGVGVAALILGLTSAKPLVYLAQALQGLGSSLIAPGIAAISLATLLPQAIVAIISPWIGRTAERSGRRPMLLLGWGLLPPQAVLYATLPGPYTLLICQALNGISGAVFGVMMTLVAADLTRGTGRFNLTLAALGVAISIGASLSTFFAGVTVAAFGGEVAYFGLALVGLCGLLLLWIAMPETHPSTVAPPEPTSAEKIGETPR